VAVGSFGVLEEPYGLPPYGSSRTPKLPTATIGFLEALGF